MSQLGHPFYGLTLTPEDKVRVHTEVFQLSYHGGGGFDHDIVYSMPIYLRYFNLRLLMQQKERENAPQNNDPPEGVRPKISRPPLVKR
jgi:hypothetical protein